MCFTQYSLTNGNVRVERKKPSEGMMALIQGAGFLMTVNVNPITR